MTHIVNNANSVFCSDSIIYRSIPGGYEPELGTSLGQLSDELNGDKIVKFVTGGAKNYALLTAGGKVIVKVKGLRLHWGNSKKVNLEAMVEMVTENRTEVMVTNNRAIVRDRKTRRVYNQDQNNLYRFQFTKRCIVNLTTPFGFKWDHLEKCFGSLIADVSRYP